MEPKARCRKGRNGPACRKRRLAKVGKVVQTIPMPASRAGSRWRPTTARRTSPASAIALHRPAGPDDVPGQEGDVIHVLRYDGKTGRERATTIPLPPPSAAPTIQDFPPEPTDQIAWPRDLAVSRDGRPLLVALNLADHAAIVDTKTKAVRYVKVGRYPYGAAIAHDGKHGLVSNEADGTVSVIDLERGEVVKTITVGPHLSHPQAIAVDPKQHRAYVAVTHQDLIAVIDTKDMGVERTLSVERPRGSDRADRAVGHARRPPAARRRLRRGRGRRVRALHSARRARARRRRGPRARSPRDPAREGRRGSSRPRRARGGRRDLGEEAEEAAEARRRHGPRCEAQGLGADRAHPGRRPIRPAPGRPRASASSSGSPARASASAERPARRTVPDDPGSATTTTESYCFKYLPSELRGRRRHPALPLRPRARASYTPRASRQIRPTNASAAAARHAARRAGRASKIKHVFYIVRENRTYDQILGDDPRGDGDRSSTLFGAEITPNAHALAQRFPLLDHVYANSEASIDGHFWTSAAAVSDYVVKNWHAELRRPQAPYDFGVYAVTWPAQRFLFDQAAEAGHLVVQLRRGDRRHRPAAGPRPQRRGGAPGRRQVPKSDLGQLPFRTARPAASNDARRAAERASGRGLRLVAPPARRHARARSRASSASAAFDSRVASDSVPAVQLHHPSPTTTRRAPARRRTPTAMIAEND